MNYELIAGTPALAESSKISCSFLIVVCVVFIYDRIYTTFFIDQGYLQKKEKDLILTTQIIIFSYLLTIHALTFSPSALASFTNWKQGTSNTGKWKILEHVFLFGYKGCWIFLNLEFWRFLYNAYFNTINLSM